MFGIFNGEMLSPLLSSLCPGRIDTPRISHLRDVSPALALRIGSTSTINASIWTNQNYWVPPRLFQSNIQTGDTFVMRGICLGFPYQGNIFLARTSVERKKGLPGTAIGSRTAQTIRASLPKMNIARGNFKMFHLEYIHMHT